MKKLNLKFSATALTKAQMQMVTGGNEVNCPCGIQTECDVLQHTWSIGLAQDVSVFSCHGVSNFYLQLMCDGVFNGTQTDGSCTCIPCGDN